MTAVVWFRRDLRLEDNPAWAAATAAHDEVVALFVLDPALLRPAGALRRAHLFARLHGLDAGLAAMGGRLRVRRGDPREVVPQEASGADALHWNDDYTPYAVARDDDIARQLADSTVRSHGGVVHPPGTVLTKAGGPYKVFTPFYRRWSALEWAPDPSPGDAGVRADPGDGLPSLTTVSAQTEDDAHRRLEQVADRVDDYHEDRDRPDLDATSRLSVDLKFGSLSPRRVIETVGDHSEGRAEFVRQIGWRDFYAHVLHHFPSTVNHAMHARYDGIAWRDADEDFDAWAAGRTGFPFVDAGMRQLLNEGWMPNRVRMVAASFLVKDLLVDWRRGERHFRHHLIDADVASNVGNWQWVAGTGADAAPYFRILNPVRQAQTHDPEGAYTRRWVPELEGLDPSRLHAPWTAGPLELAAAGITLGDTYPHPIVDHSSARERTLEAFEEARE